MGLPAVCQSHTTILGQAANKYEDFHRLIGIKTVFERFMSHEPL